MRRRPGMFFGLVAVLALALVCTAALAQGPGRQGGQQQQRGPGGWQAGPGGWQQGPGPGAGVGPGPGFGPMGPMGGPMMMRAMATPAIAVAGGKVFVAAGGVLYRFDAETLELELKVEYAPMTPPMGPGGPGGPPPGQGGMLPPVQPPAEQ